MIEGTTPDVLNAKGLLMYLKKSSSSAEESGDGENEDSDDFGNTDMMASSGLPTGSIPSAPTTGAATVAAKAAAAVRAAAAARAAASAVATDEMQATGGTCREDPNERHRVFLGKSLASRKASRYGDAAPQDKRAAGASKIPGASGWPSTTATGVDEDTAMDDADDGDTGVELSRGSRSVPRLDTVVSTTAGTGCGGSLFSKGELPVATATSAAEAAAIADVHQVRDVAAAPAVAPTAMDSAPGLLSVAQPTAASRQSITSLPVAAANTRSGQLSSNRPAVCPQEAEMTGRRSDTQDIDVEEGHNELAPASASASAFPTSCPPESPAVGSDMAQRQQREWMGQPSPFSRRSSSAVAHVLNPSAFRTPSAAVSSQPSLGSTPTASGPLSCSVVTPSPNGAHTFTNSVCPFSETVSPSAAAAAAAEASTPFADGTKPAVKRPRVGTTPIAVVPASPWGETSPFSQPQQRQQQHDDLSCSAPAAKELPTTAAVGAPTNTLSGNHSEPVDLPTLALRSPFTPPTMATSTFPTTSMVHRGGGATGALPVTAPLDRPIAAVAAVRSSSGAAGMSTTSTKRKLADNEARTQVPAVSHPPLAVLSKARSRAAAAAAALAADKKKAEKARAAAVSEYSAKKSAERFFEISQETGGKRDAGRCSYDGQAGSDREQTKS